MLNFPPAVRIWLGTAPLDLRRSFDRLAAEVREQLHNDPLSGHVFVFRNKRGDRVKLLYWDEDGYVIVYKRLEQGVFSWPAASGGQLVKWRSEMPPVPSAYEPSGALPASAVLFLLLGSVVGCVAGLFAGTVIGSAGFALLGKLLFPGPGFQCPSDYPWPIMYVVICLSICLFTILSAYYVTGWVSAWCT